MSYASNNEFPYGGTKDIRLSLTDDEKLELMGLILDAKNSWERRCGCYYTNKGNDDCVRCVKVLEKAYNQIKKQVCLYDGYAR